MRARAERTYLIGTRRRTLIAQIPLYRMVETGTMRYLAIATKMDALEDLLRNRWI
jgi:hypothetical protein